MPLLQNKRWTIKPLDNLEKVERLASDINVSIPIANILVSRGINSFEEAKTFFRPSLSDLYDPFLMKDMDKAVERIEEAIHKNQRILIYGDYDVDGTTSVSLVYSYLKQFHTNIDYYIPDRYSEGYGISFKGIDFAADHDISLIIALDCGIKAVDKIAYANDKNIDFIICDHHLPGESLPEAFAVLDPKRDDCLYPYKELSGCGVGFKLMQAYAQKNNISFETLMPYLDLVAISIGCDIVPLTGENRVLAYYGLQEVNKTKRKGLLQILELTAKKEQNLTITDLVFVIGPRINAAGRIESASNAVKLLISDSEEEAEDYGNLIHEMNDERKGLDQEITREALEMIEELDMVGQKTTVLYKEDWHKGVIGIVASRLIETYYRPTIILTESNGKVAGSARSVVGYSVYDAIDACSDLLIQFGGHKYAAGLTMEKENVEAFQKKFEQVVASSIPDELLIPEIKIDAEVELHQISTNNGKGVSNFYKVMSQLAPFGPQNMKPVFVARNVMDNGWGKIVGEDHLKLKVFQPDYPSIQMDCIGFGLGEMMHKIGSGVTFDIVFTIEENTWNGQTNLQLNLKDIRL